MLCPLCLGLLGFTHHQTLVTEIAEPKHTRKKTHTHTQQSVTRSSGKALCWRPVSRALCVCAACVAHCMNAMRTIDASAHAVAPPAKQPTLPAAQNVHTRTHTHTQIVLCMVSMWLYCERVKHAHPAGACNCSCCATCTRQGHTYRIPRTVWRH